MKRSGWKRTIALSLALLLLTVPGTTFAAGNGSAYVRVDKLLSSLGPGAPIINTTGADRWIRLPDLRWVLQRPDNTLYKNTWVQVDGKWYLFDADGIMQSNGWRCVNHKWYYLDPQGALLVNTTTPDGYTVNASGEWVQNGQVVIEWGRATKTADTEAKAGANAVAGVLVTARETTVTPGKPKNLTVTASGATVENVTYSKPYEQWKAGESIRVEVTLVPRAGMSFASSTKFTTYAPLTLVSNHGDSSRRVITLSFKPSADLTAPTGFFMTSDEVLHWARVEGATRYILKVTPEDEKTRMVVTEKPECDMSDFTLKESRVSIKAAGPENSKNITTSREYVIKNLDVLLDTAIPGTFTIRNKKPYYESETGEKGGWKKIPDVWYHFKKSGYADGPGWFQDVDGNWYYFDGEYRMMTGVITDGGKQYVLNDGTNGNFPYGAWVH